MTCPVCHAAVSVYKPAFVPGLRQLVRHSVCGAAFFATLQTSGEFIFDVDAVSAPGKETHG